MGTAYITQEDAFIGKVDERLCVKFDKKTILDIPLLKVDGIVVIGRATVSPATISELLDRHIPLTFLTETGRYLGRLEPEVSKNIFVRKAQWQAAGESPQAIHLVQSFVRGKLKNYRNVLQRRQREFTDLDLSEHITRIERAIAPIDTTHNINSLRGLEGAGSAAYFGCFNQLIRNPEFQFTSRVRRPPTDPVNSLLSFGYSLLCHDVQSAVNIVGFDPYLGYLHCERYGRPSLALDLMEEFRPLVADAVVLTTLNKRLLTPKDFVTESLSSAVSLTPEGRKTFLQLYTQKKQSEFKHPVFGRKCTYQEAFELQARLLAKYLMGEIEKYPPLVWK
ncbi:type I-D CRISPR-associated endonuclease Cas1d [Aetokthonos hydrillicola Thurmond2011]|jgi:CRISPR-associated protein Cas1|uniref:CRISPR-associated endonuclease Cas1 n=1 Tax=Aetokthonos hydrillicola Thurmond2011 TaxID=2712845 RepID=A0AAP5MAG1_9CYAN|nr:type I-D CRISPR-associated endonuclease Cas1d [Aetokthonos hydrillicola]MBO3458934.1 type I-D CRISPR-associated endonuclease Cas1 [Aetokthonos hydrillicola CCALA 1050]MBW4587215.1 type I-D CRISPR-associated endonuclease Cas1d [Aetokthonos hydrillicola CCALA 1050]MDR9896762.1 type I-D CRISPR-associated endonuclease Cas1d [Aetokthonos hydrillicola Thurmond2011]